MISLGYILILLFGFFVTPIKKAKWLEVFVVTIVLLLFSYFNRTGSWDFYGYIDYYKCSIGEQCRYEGFESSFRYLSQIFSLIDRDFGFDMVYLFYLFFALVIKVTLFKNNSAYFGVAVFSYLSYLFYLHELTQIRAALSISLSWLSILFWSEGKRKSSVCLFILSTFFHMSGVITIIAIFSSFFSRKFLIISVMLSIFIGRVIQNVGISSLPAFPIERVNVYLSALGSEVLITSQLSVYAIFILILLLLSPLPDKLDKFSNIIVNSTFLGLIVYFLFYYIPVIPIRTFEFLSSGFPFIIAIIYSRANFFIRGGLILLCIVVLFNLSIRNNTRMDMIFDWHNIDIRSLNDVQRAQYYDEIKPY